MISQARKKFIIWAMIAMTVIVVVLAAAVNIVNWNLTDRNLSAALKELAETTAMNGPEETEAKNNEENAGRQETGESADGEAGRKQDADNGGKQDADKGADNDGKQDADRGMESVNDQDDHRKGTGKENRGRTSAMNQYGTRYFIMILDSEGQMLNYAHENEIVSADEALTLADEAWKSGKKEGYLDDFKYLVYEERNGNTLVCFLDCSTNIKARNTLLLISIIVGAAGILLGFFFILFMSGKTVEPVKISIEKQKQFITNAGHELKTPLSAIATNMDILTMDLGENEWVEGTQKQVRKLRKLVENLVALSRLEEEDQDLMMQTFSASDCAAECVDGFESIAKAQGKKLDADIEEGLEIQGDPGMVQQLFSILCDNALKYASGDGPVEVRLQKEGRHVVFSTANPWEQDVDPEQLEMLFERFYRGDPARASETKSAGHGLGLSIAQAMAEKSKARLTVSTDERGWIVFRVMFS